MKKFEWYIALRYILSGKRHRFTSFISVMAVVGVAIGVMALIVVIAVMAGFQKELRDRLIGINAHVMVQRLGGEIADYEELAQKIASFRLKKSGFGGFWASLRGEGEVRVRAVLPCIYLQGLLSSAQGQSGVVIRGIDPEIAAKVFTSLKLKKGWLSALADGDFPGIVLGRRLAEALGVNLNDRVRLIVPQGRATPFGLLPKIKTFKVVGIFESGLYEFDASLAFISLPAAQKLLNMGHAVSLLEVRLTDPFYATEFSEALAKELGFPYWVIDWRRMNASLFSALKLEKMAMFVILTLIVLVAAFNIVAALIMLVSEKREDIAILKSMGAGDRSILRIFMLTGFLLGASGMIFGVLGGLGLCVFLVHYPLVKLPTDVYPVDHLPVMVEPFDVTIIAFSALLLALLATIYPARQAAKLPPAEVLRYG
jgi:lipoprotein-releasing system permease protein